MWDFPLPPIVAPQWQAPHDNLTLYSHALHLWWLTLPPDVPREVTLRAYLRRYQPNLGEKPLPRTAGGKPYLDALEFNWSHSGNLAVLAVSGRAAVGVDAEILRPCPQRSAISRRFFGAALQQRILEGSDRSFLQAWTYYEAWLKAQGIGVWQRTAAQPLEHWAVSFPVGDRAIASVVVLTPTPLQCVFFRPEVVG
ncbi:4'-phosphopantetheinyl transferase superfamily protein [Thermosynechococcus sp. B0]|uniref:4'-phosphopantetheinyl transferase family protein n=1 Tax=unclassified Thermosynechococcus TaxID=2622553 RepID=UPI002576A5CA|nr:MULTISPECIES: 4'-phosphopantetheinyl transferase superfamily protein [unclassified Thermosynechococcus]WJI23008.1 4'-phosphopantetheinyl transferase superfamily protein [Thermosynechococcus sp. B0]WJI25523.1 4'-phosphopantetheinyl transferase superfamily protein [Thermosynechococcus sp. B1]WJI28055.1 4'-phosphopantetheinyl transferase superfamily protein [Thermosynechococcus sp. B3]